MGYLITEFMRGEAGGHQGPFTEAGLKEAAQLGTDGAGPLVAAEFIAADVIQQQNGGAAEAIELIVP